VSEFLFQTLEAAFGGLSGGEAAVFNVVSAIVQDFPDNGSQMTGNGPNGFRITESGQEAFEFVLEETVVGPNGSLRRLAERSSEIGIAFRGSTTVVALGAFFAAWANADPGTELGSRGKGTGGSAGFGNDVLSAQHADAGHLGQAAHRLGLLAHNFRG
jgi:hypothetical protein